MFKILTVNNKCVCEMNIANNKKSVCVNRLSTQHLLGTNVKPAIGDK
jgi:hypothetical protein